jgi:2-polyprenyl-6-methoxyphenol hydroxylase-like FAD-dependent oxidoreductase
MPGSDLNVIIIGAGVGGLCLAQGLRQAGVPVRVYERDQAPDARLQGYRLNIEPMGSRALADCLPGRLWQLLVATAGDPGPGMGVYTHRMKLLMREPGETPPDPADGTHAVSRATLRRVLLAGLDDVAFGQEFTRYSRDGDQVTAHFADGTAATGTLLVGADGARSRVRQQFLPRARVTGTGGFGVGGKVILTDETARWLPRALTESKNMILPRKDFLFTAVFRRRLSTERAADELRGPLAAAGIDADDALREAKEPDYVMWAYVANDARYPDVRPTAGGEVLQAAIARRNAAWHPALRRLVAASDPATVSRFEFTAARPVKPWPTGNVTLLGDAIHHMPPVGGIGGNTALVDARDLCQMLREAGSGDPAQLRAALAGYERQMLKRGFGAVSASRRYLTLAISRNPALRLTALGFFRLCGAVPPLGHAVFAD